MRAAAWIAAPCTGSVSLSLFTLPTVAGFYLASRLSITYLFFTSDPEQGAMASFAINISFLLLAAFYCFGPGRSAAASPVRTSRLGWVTAFLLFSLCSLLWSETVSLGVAFAYWLAMAADVAIVVMLVRSGSIAIKSAQIMRGFVFGACFLALVMWLSPTMSDLRPGDDDFFSPNAIGFTCAFSVFFAQFLAHTNRTWRYPAIFLAISLLRSLSKTTIVAFIASQLLLLARDQAISRRSKALLLAGAGLVVAAFWNLLTAYYVVYTNAGNQAETLTGRLGIWAVVLERSFERPWLGHGFHSFRNVIPPFGSFAAWHAHNELLQQFYAYGVVGIILLCGLYGSFFRQARRISDASRRSLLLGLLAMILIRGLADTERFDLSFPLWSIALLSLTSSALDARREMCA